MGLKKSFSYIKMDVYKKNYIQKDSFMWAQNLWNISSCSNFNYWYIDIWFRDSWMKLNWKT